MCDWWCRRTPGGKLDRRLSLGELGHGLSSLRNGVLGKFTWKHKANCGLNFPGSEGGCFVHSAKLGSFHGDFVESIGDEVVHDGDSLLGDSGIWVHLLQDFKDVRLEGSWGSTLLDALRSRLLHDFSHIESLKDISEDTFSELVPNILPEKQPTRFELRW